MTDQKLIEQLRELAEWAAANEWETPLRLGDVLTMAADRLEEGKNETIGLLDVDQQHDEKEGARRSQKS